jgi:transcriptional regulator GlxA family with amidase domain
MQRIGFIVFPGFQVMSFAVIAVFEFANKERGDPVYDVRLLSETGGFIRSSFGMTVAAELINLAIKDAIAREESSCRKCFPQTAS